MAEKSLAEKLKLLDKISDSINDKAGKKLVGRIGREPELMEKLTIKYIPTPSQNVNVAMGGNATGGFPRRRTTIVAGMPDSGKTSLVLESIALAMKKDPNFVAGWLESENSLEEKYICDTFGIDKERFCFIDHDRKGAGEKALDAVETILASGAVDIVVINSLKCLVPSDEFNKDMSSAQVANQARMNAKMMRKFTSLVSESNAAFVIITHLTTQIGSMSRDPMIISGGNAIVYGASIILDLRKKSIQDNVDPINREEGVKIGVTVKKNHCVPDRNPYLKTDYYAVFGQGIEKYLEALENAVQAGLLVKAGSYIRDVDENNEVKSWNGELLNFQGKNKFRQFCIDHPDYFEDLLKRIGGGHVVQMSAEEIDGVEKEITDIEEGLPSDVVQEIDKSEGSKKRSKKKTD